MPAEIRADGESFRLADREVRPRLNEIEGPSGIERLNPRAMQVLVALARREDGFASKRELLDEVWTDLFVSEEVLTTAVWELRRALGDDARAPCFIRTVPRRGYQLLPGVEPRAERTPPPASPAAAPTVAPDPRDESPAAAARARPIAVAAGVTVLLLAAAGTALLVRRDSAPSRPAVRSIAVLPFAALGGDPRDAALADGLTDTLITALAEEERFRVVSRASVLAVDASHRTAPEIGRALDADALVEGTLAREGDRIVLNAQLIDARTDQHLWARTYERRFEHLLDLQVEVARSLGAAIAPHLDPAAAAQTARVAEEPTGPPGRAWRFRTSGEIWSDPVRAGNAVLFGSRDGHLYSVDLATGEERWRLRVGQEVRVRPLVAGNLVVALAAEGTLVAAELESGTELWRSSLPAPAELPPVLARERIVTADEAGKVCAFDLRSGRELWRAALSGSIDGLAANDSTVLVSDWGASLHALDPVSGTARWQAPLGDRAASNLTLAGDRILLPMADDTIRVLALADGRELWRRPFEAPTSAIAWRDRILVAGARGALAALDRESGEPIWRFQARGGVARPAVAGDRVLAGSHDLSLYVLDAWNGEQSLRVEMQAWILTEPLLVSEILVFGSLDGSVYGIPLPEDAPAPRRIRQADGFRISAERASPEPEVAVQAAEGTTPPPSVRWHRRLDGSIVRAPAVDAATVYVGVGRSLQALDRETGQERWRVELGGEASTRPLLEGDSVLVGSRDDSLYALDARTGEEIWRFTTGGDILSTPASRGGALYFGSRDGYFYAVGAADGRELWRRPLDVIHSSPAIADGVLFVATRGDRVHALALADGGETWTATTADWAVADLALAEPLVLVASCDGTVQALDIASGDERWRFVTRGEIWYRPLVSGGRLFFGSADFHLYAVDLESGSEAWRLRTGNRALSSVVAWRGLVLAGSYDRHLYAVDAASGKLAWKIRTPGAVASPTVADDQVAFGTADGRMLLVDLTTSGAGSP